jgi:hypothetical protein
VTGHRPPGVPLSVWLTGQQPARVQRAGRYLPAATAHPAKMLPAIAAQVIERYTGPGEWVADPMCGIGTTLTEAVHTGRNAIGVEYEPRWAAIAAAGLGHARRQGAGGHGEVLRADARHLAALIPPRLHGQIALVLTSPPYGSSLHGHMRSSRDSGQPGITKTNHRYSQDRRNLAHRDLGALLEGFTEILAGCAVLLRPGGTLAITTRPIRRNGALSDLPSAVLQAGESAGLVPAERLAALICGLRDGGLVTRASFFAQLETRRLRERDLPAHVIAHEDLLIFRKPVLKPLTAADSGRPRHSLRRRAVVGTRPGLPESPATLSAADGGRAA